MSLVYELWEAVRSGDGLQVKEFFKKKPSAKWCVNEYVGFLTCLHLSCIEGFTETCQILLAQKADPHLKAKVNDWTALHFAAKNGHLECMKLLISCNKNLVTERNNKGQTPLYAAVCNDQHSAVKVLLQYKSKVNIRDHTGKTPLHYAVQFGHLRCLKSLIDSGADPRRIVSLTDSASQVWVSKDDDKSDMGKTAFDLAVENKQHTVADFLTQLGANVVGVSDNHQVNVNGCSDPSMKNNSDFRTVFVTKF